MCGKKRDIGSKEDIESIIGCLFCRIYRNQKNLIVYETEDTFTIHDLHKSSAQEHLLVCPKRHIKHLMVLESGDIPLLQQMKSAAFDFAKILAPGKSIL